ncbi:MAG: YgeY family selenium metabolism-linked hydrolase [candidate division Zixibacteria bacterium]|nr:YgeY family selenium metabolism-linked hydrolase [candidate division Zixibacteria bacterium]
MSKSHPSIIMQKAEEYRDYSANVLSSLIKIPSVSGNEEKIVRFLEKEFKKCGADDVQIDDFGNIIARLGNTGTVVAYDAHIDTVDIGEEKQWDTDPFSGEIKDEKVYGRGASDQKAGMASMLTALKILAEMKKPLPFTAYFVGSVLEEDCDGLCWQYIVKENKLRPDLVIITEPTDGKINRGQRGRMEIEVVVEGVSCHGSAPERGDNAIYKIAPIITALEKLNDVLPIDPFLGKGTLAASRLRSNSPSLCAVADKAAIYIDRRLTWGESPEQAVKQLESLPEIKAANASVQIPIYERPSWRGLVYPTPKKYPTWIMAEDHQFLKNAVKYFESLFKSKPVVDKWTFSTNGVASMGMFDIPTFGFGPGMEKMAHAPNEYAAIDDLCRCAAFYAGFPWEIVSRE